MLQRLLPYTPERDAYRLLQLSPGASPTEIVEACRRLSRTFHPDRNGSHRATEEMQVVNAVRRLLTDPHARAEYDRERRRWHAVEEARRRARVTSLPGIAGAGPGVGRSAAPMAAGSPPAIAPGRAAARRLAVRVRSVWAGVRAALIVLGPPRCGTCAAVIERGDAFCPLCGTRLLGSSASIRR